MRRLALSVLIQLLLLPVALTLRAQAPVIQWQKIWGSTNGDYPTMIRPTSDGGYIVVGYTEGADGDVLGYHGNVGVGDLWVIKMNSLGQMEWQKTLGGIYAEPYTGDVLQTPDGGFLVAGSSASVDCGIVGNHGGLDAWLVKLKPNGDIAWQKMIGGEYNEYLASIDPTADGGYILGGYSNSVTGLFSNHHGTNSTFDWWIAKVDGNGNQLWQVTLGGSADDQCFSARATPDGGVIAAGTVQSSDGDVAGLSHGLFDYMVVKIDASGAVQWKKTYGGSGYDQGWCVQLTPDGGYVVAGRSSSHDGDVSGNHGAEDYWILKLTSAGAIQWQKSYGGTKNEEPFYIQNTADGGFVLTGSAESNDGDVGCNSGDKDVWILKIDGSGNKQWSKVLGGSAHDESLAIQPLTDGSFIVAANTCSLDIPGNHPRGSTGTCGDYWIVKLTAPQAVAPAPVLTISPADAKVCAGSASTFTATVVNTGVRPVYQWTKNGSPVGTNSPNYTASDFQDNDVLAVNIISGSGSCDITGSPASASVTVHLNNTVLQPQIKIGSATSFLCNCAPATFKATVTGGGSRPSYQWQLNGVVTGINSDTWLSNGLKPTDVVSCVYSDSSGCIANAPLLSNKLSLQPGTGAPATVSIEGPKDPPCSGSTVTFTADPVNAGPGPTYQWSVNGVNAGTNNYQFISSLLKEGDVIGCTITPDVNYPCASGGNTMASPLVVHFQAKAAPVATITAPAATICTGHLLTLTATTQYAGSNPGYQWSVDGVAAGTNSPTFSSNGFADGDIVQCAITVDPAYGCALQPTAVSNLVTVQVLNQPDPSVAITSSVPAACAGTVIAFTADVKNAGSGTQLQWLVNSQPTGDKGPTFSSSTLPSGAVVVCQVTPGPGACSSSPTQSNGITETIWPLPAVAISPADTLVLYDGQATLHAGFSADVTNYQWSPAAELENAQAVNPTTLPLTDSVHFVLTAYTANQCSSKALAVVKIYRALNMPGAFSPNGDGVNDVFRIPPGITMQLNQFAVYDRWGTKVFSTTNAGQGWDGTIAGRPQPAGVYIYFIVGSDLKGPVNTKGTVVLVR
jgi:gliding motility-associated-like protein